MRYSRTLGNKNFEMGNHLENVLATVSDQKISVEDNGFMDYYLPKMVSYSDYYPFGMQMEGRNGGMDYRYGFQRQELLLKLINGLNVEPMRGEMHCKSNWG